MARPVKWPPTIHPGANGTSRIKVRGVFYQLGPAGSPEARAEYARLCALLAGPGGGPPAASSAPPPGSLTVAEVVARWEEHAAVRYAADSDEVVQLRLALEPLVRLYGGRPAADFGPVQLEELQLAMATGSWMTAADRAHPRRPKSGGWASGTVGRRATKVRRVFAWAEKHGYVPRGSWSSLKTAEKLPRHHPGVRHTKRRRPATLDQVKRVCRRLAEPFASILLLLWWTGARPKELRTMTAGEVDRSDPRCWRYRPGRHKTAHRGDVHTVAIGPRGIAVLRPWLAMAAALGPSAPVFTLRRDPKAEGVRARHFSRAVRVAALAAGLPGWIPYGCRHAAKQRIARQFGAEGARAVLGHRSINTQEAYGAVDADLAAEVQRKVG